MPLSSKYYTEKEVAELLQCSIQTLRNDRSKKVGIPYHKIGGRIRYGSTDIEHYLESVRVPTTAPEDNPRGNITSGSSSTQ